MTIAWRAASEGHEVALIDDRPGRGATWAAAGMLAPVTEANYGEEELVELNLASRRRWPSFAAALAEAAGRPSGYRECGTLLVARDEDELAVLDDLLVFQQELGLDVERLASRDCRRLEPGLSPRIRAGLLAVDDHQVDNRALVRALTAACHRTGVRHLAQRATTVTRRGGRVTGVRLADASRVQARTVVVAAGCWSAHLDGVGDLPVRPVKGQLVHLRGSADPPLATRNVRGLDVYVVPRADGRVVVGSTVEERGYDTAVTAGAVLDLLRRAYALVPGITELELVETTAGLRPGSPDNAPLIGTGTLEGLVVATGHYRNGLLLTPVTADAVLGYLRDGRLPDGLDAFRPDRFPPVRSTGSSASAQPTGFGSAAGRNRSAGDHPSGSGPKPPMVTDAGRASTGRVAAEQQDQGHSQQYGQQHGRQHGQEHGHEQGQKQGENG